MSLMELRRTLAEVELKIRNTTDQSELIRLVEVLITLQRSLIDRLDKKE